MSVFMTADEPTMGATLSTRNAAVVLELTPAMAVEAERLAIIDHFAEKKAEVQAMIGRRVTAAEATTLIRRLDAIADGIAAGLHR